MNAEIKWRTPVCFRFQSVVRRFPYLACKLEYSDKLLAEVQLFLYIQPFYT